MLIALETPQLLLMLLGFAGMLGFAGIALWLWWRQENPQPESSAGRTRAASREQPRAASAPAAEQAAEQAIEPHQPEYYEPTEFIALPGQRELDSPLGSSAATEIVAAFPDEPRAEIEAQEDKTEFIAPRLDDELDAEAVERTAMIPSALVLERQRLTAASTPEPTPDKTEFIAAPPTFTAPVHTPTPAPASPSTPSVDLREHFSLAAEAFEQLWSATTPASLEAWRGHLEVLASTPSAQLDELLRPVLDGPPNDHRWAAALRVLLHNKSWSAKRAFPQLLTEFDEAQRDAALRVLRSWDDPRAQTIAAAGLSLASASLRATWLECFADRGWDPGAEVIDAALTDSDPRVVSAGLRALPSCEAAASLEPKLASHLFASDPSVRIQAIETALLFANNSAWLVCHQLARNPSFPIAAELVGLLGTEPELSAMRRALDASPTPSLLRGLGLSGRRSNLDACVARFDDEDAELHAAARACLGFAAGRGFESGAEAREWLDAQTHARLLGGGPRSSAQVLKTLATADLPLRRAIARELRVRSRARLHLDVDTLPDAWRRQLERLGASGVLGTIDFERGFPWSDERAA